MPVPASLCLYASHKEPVLTSQKDKFLLGLADNLYEKEGPDRM